MTLPTKLLFAALICAPLTLLIPAQQADACSPPEPGLMFDGPPALPAMGPAQAAIPIKFHSSDSTFGVDSFSVQVFNNKGVEIAGSLSIVHLIQDEGIFPQYNALLVWRPDADMGSGEHLVNVKTIPSPDVPGREQTLNFSIDIDANAPTAQLAAPTLTAALKATPIGVDRTCCPIPEISTGSYGNPCVLDDGYDLQEPLGARVNCGPKDNQCELCWPARYEASPTLDASWAPAVNGLPAELTYYEVTLSSANAQKTGTFYGADDFVYSFGADNMDASYCVSITAFGLVDSPTATVERCFDRADLPALPADVGAVTGTDRRMECIPPDEPDMGTSDMDAPDMAEADMDASDMDSADMDSADMSAADMDAADMSVPGKKTTTSGDGGCATPGGASPVAPALLAAFGLVGWLRRRRG